MKNLIFFSLLLVLMPFSSWSQEIKSIDELESIQSITPAEFEEIHRAFEFNHHTLRCEMANDILSTLPYASEEDFDTMIDSKLSTLEKLSTKTEGYQAKLVVEQVKILKKLKRAQSRKSEVQAFLTTLCNHANTTATLAVQNTGYIANLINETMKLPVGFLLNFTRSSISGKEITDKRVLLRSYAGKGIEQSIATYGIERAYKIVRTAGNMSYLPLLLAPIVDFTILNLCADLNRLNPEEINYCQNYEKLKKFYQKMARSGSKLGAKFHDIVTKDKPAPTEPTLPTKIDNDNLCEYMINAKKSSLLKERKKSMTKDSLKALLASEELAKPERFDFTTSQDNLEQFDLNALPEMKNVVISLDLSETIKNLDSSKTELKRVQELEEILKSYQKKLKSLRKQKTISSCNQKKKEIAFDYLEYEKNYNELNGSRLRKAALESSVVNKQIKQAQSFWRFFNKAKLDWQVINTNSVHMLREILERKDILNVFIVTHSEGNLGKLLDSELNQIPTTFFKNISPNILSLSFYTCHSQNVMKNYDLENILNNSKSIHPRRTLNFVQAGEFLNENDLAPIMGIKDYLQKVDRSLLRSLKGSLLQQTLLDLPEAKKEEMCKIELADLKIEAGTVGLQLNQNLVLTSDKNFHVRSDTFPCRLMKAAGENTVVIYNLNLIEKLKFNHAEMTKFKLTSPQGDSEITLKHFFDRKTGEYQSSKATF